LLARTTIKMLGGASTTLAAHRREIRVAAERMDDEGRNVGLYLAAEPRLIVRGLQKHTDLRPHHQLEQCRR
jgi:hypothetical protein